MTLFGDRSWYLHRWLAWLPAFGLEAAPQGPDAGPTGSAERELDPQPA
jgi:hypothetical protein